MRVVKPVVFNHWGGVGWVGWGVLGVLGVSVCVCSDLPPTDTAVVVFREGV